MLFTLNGHKERVNSVAWITRSHLVSVSSDGDIVVWEVDPANILDGASYKISQRFEKAHEGTTINYLTHLNIGKADEEVYFATMGVNGSLNFYAKD